MSSIHKHYIINKIGLPMEIIDIVKEYTFNKIKKIPKHDIRYHMLSNIPLKEYYNGNTYVYMNIGYDKDYYLVHTNTTLQIQVLGYGDGENGYEEGEVYFIGGDIFDIE